MTEVMNSLEPGTEDFSGGGAGADQDTVSEAVQEAPLHRGRADGWSRGGERRASSAGRRTSRALRTPKPGGRAPRNRLQVRTSVSVCFLWSEAERLISKLANHN
ncbi:hypothetical protein L3Q82_026246 [Scortum barcoo]|uniref:Uncharacterized protein n=1 Tax=Scortum barcoo TaxID=214431 RepID=A0ACB8WI19_9TELE|nr:hypothetical protein L3Q82_026246 [Scortum barcoo]